MRRFEVPVSIALLLLVALAGSPAAKAQPPEPSRSTQAAQPQTPSQTATDKKVLTIDEYGRWRSVGSAAISADGAWVTFAYSKREADDELHIQNVDGGAEHVIERGSGAQFSDDGRWVVYRVSLPWDEIEERQEQREPVPVGAELMDLASGTEVASWDDIERFEFGGAAALAIERRRPEQDSGGGSGRDRAGRGGRGGNGGDEDDGDNEPRGGDLILRYLRHGTDELLGSVDEWAFNEDGTHLAYTVDAADDHGNGVYLIEIESGRHAILDGARAEYARLTWDEDGTSLAVLRGKKPEGYDERDNVLLLFPGIAPEAAGASEVAEAEVSTVAGRAGASSPSAAAGSTARRAAGGGGASAASLTTKIVYDPSGDDAFPDGFVVSERGTLEWNEGASRLFFGIKEQLPVPDKTDEPISDVNVFHWNDDRIQWVQQAQAERDRNFTYRSVLNLDAGGGSATTLSTTAASTTSASPTVASATSASNSSAAAATVRFVRLADERMRTVAFAGDGRWAVGQDDRDYISDWKPDVADFYRIDTTSGERTLMLEAQETRHALGFSPDGRHFLYWKDEHVHDWRLEEGEPVSLTAAAPVSFLDREWDYIGVPPPYGVAGWTKDGSAVVLEHRYDLWLQPLDGSAATNLTNGAGDRAEIRFRIVDLERDGGGRFGGGGPQEIDLGEPQFLTAYGQWTKKAGYFVLPPGGGEPVELVWADKRLSTPTRAAEADRFYYSVEDFRQFPDWWVADADLATASRAGDAADSGGETLAKADTGFDTPTRITDANPWQDEYRWGRRILFDYSNDDGVRLQGTLAIPDDYIEGQRRPMIVRFYEKMSQNLHSYPAPGYSHRPMYAGYVSAGYLVMEPDVHFRGGTSHSDMLECVEAAVHKVVEMGYADPEAVGLNGHSYSGGGSSYIAARSDMFAAVVSGAAPINLTSEFNQIFPGSGQNNARYDIHGQGRYGTDPYTDPELYAEQSPITWAATMDTPLIYLHGEDDQTVGYYQGMEWYNALRFLEKPVIFLSYPGEGHGLRQYENQIDFQRRMREFFDHHLRGEPAPEWMTEGVPFLEKQRNLRRRKR